MEDEKYAENDRSVIDEILLQNLRNIRQRHSDALWKHKAEERIREHESRKVDHATISKSKVKKQNGSLRISKRQVRDAQNELIMEYKSMGLVPQDWEPNRIDELPEFPDSRRKMAESLRISPERLRELEEGRLSFRASEAIDIARIGDMDIASVLTPPLENLELDEYIDLKPISPKSVKVFMFEYLLWIRCFRPLPEQDKLHFIESTVNPIMYQFNNPKAVRYRDPEELERERAYRAGSKVNVILALSPTQPINIQGAPQTPFDVPITKRILDAPLQRFIIRNTLAASAHIKMLFRVERPKNVTKEKANFNRQLNLLRYAIVSIVVSLIGARKK